MWQLTGALPLPQVTVPTQPAVGVCWSCVFPDWIILISSSRCLQKHSVKTSSSVGWIRASSKPERGSSRSQISDFVSSLDPLHWLQRRVAHAQNRGLSAHTLLMLIKTMSCYINMQHHFYVANSKSWTVIIGDILLNMLIIIIITKLSKLSNK